MATIQGIRAAHARMAALWHMTRAEQDRLAEAAPQWSALCRDIDDEELLRRILAHTDRDKPPPLAMLLGHRAKRTQAGGTACTVCEGSGRRQVLRWVEGEHGPTCQELTVRCPCAAGEGQRGNFPDDLPTWMERWTRSPNTIDGPHPDPDPAHRVEPARRRAFIRAAEGRVAAVEVMIGRSCA